MGDLNTCMLCPVGACQCLLVPWCRAIGDHPALTHLDFSNACLGLPECTLLGAALARNHTIMGLHMAGNKCSVNPRGFIDGACGVVSHLRALELVYHAHACDFVTTPLDCIGATSRK